MPGALIHFFTRIKQSSYWSSLVSTETAEDGRRHAFFLLGFSLILPQMLPTVPSAFGLPPLFFPTPLSSFQGCAPSGDTQVSRGGDGQVVSDSSLIDSWSLTQGCITLVLYYAEDLFLSRMGVRLSQCYNINILIFTFPWLFKVAFPLCPMNNPPTFVLFFFFWQKVKEQLVSWYYLQFFVWTVLSNPELDNIWAHWWVISFAPVQFWCSCEVLTLRPCWRHLSVPRETKIKLKIII